MFGLFLLPVSLLVPSVCLSSHTLQYTFTLISSSASPTYFIVAFVDKAQIGRYTSETQWVEPLLDWKKERLEPKHWETMTFWGRHYQNCHTKDMAFFRDRFNRTYGDGGHYIYRVKFACEVEEDCTVQGDEAFAFNGNEFTFFNKDNMRFVAVNCEAEVIAQEWNRQQLSAIKHKKHMEQDYIEFWVCTTLDCLSDTVRPKVKVFPRKSDSETKLHCWVNGFYPRDVLVRWLRNGIELEQRDRVGATGSKPGKRSPALTGIAFVAVGIAVVVIGLKISSA
ncbi:hypothetical protein XELAEV_18000950mg [Xenopus laevis]|nr:hypothetical protein XELAEV_18000950mg [Xenopus laevis]